MRILSIAITIILNPELLAFAPMPTQAARHLLQITPESLNEEFKDPVFTPAEIQLRHRIIGQLQGKERNPFEDHRLDALHRELRVLKSKFLGERQQQTIREIRKLVQDEQIELLVQLIKAGEKVHNDVLVPATNANLDHFQFPNSHYDLLVDMEASSEERIRGVATLDWLRLDQSAETMILDIGELEILEVKVNGNNVAFETRDGIYEKKRRALVVPNLPKINSGEIEVTYLLRELTGDSMFFTADEMGMEGNLLLLESEPDSASTWIPTIDASEHRSKFSYKIRVKGSNQPLMALATADDNPDMFADIKEGVRTYELSSETALPSYLQGVAIGSFKSVELKNGSNRVRMYIPSLANEQEYLAQFSIAPDMIAQFQQHLDVGPLPGWLAILPLPITIPFGGSEADGLHVINRGVVIEETLAHEDLHQYGPGGNRSLTPWSRLMGLKEGLAQIGTILGLEWKDPLSRSRSIYLYKRLSRIIKKINLNEKNNKTNENNVLIGDVSPEFSSPLYYFIDSEVHYEKGMLFWYLVLKTVGEQRFTSYLADLTKKYAGKNAGFSDILTDLFHKFPKLEQDKEFVKLAAILLFLPELPKVGIIDGEEEGILVEELLPIKKRIEEIITALQEGNSSVLSEIGSEEYALVISEILNREELTLQQDATVNIVDAIWADPRVPKLAAVTWFVYALGQGFYDFEDLDVKDRMDWIAKNVGAGRYKGTLFNAMKENQREVDAKTLFKKYYGNWTDMTTKALFATSPWLRSSVPQ